jgi:hypothetical protein
MRFSGLLQFTNIIASDFRFYSSFHPMSLLPKLRAVASLAPFSISLPAPISEPLKNPTQEKVSGASASCCNPLSRVAFRLWPQYEMKALGNFRLGNMAHRNVLPV